ncbi:MAG: AmmeMemoRadiSam system radical SAM enzyme [Promethearchaeota archaeon]
MDIVSQKFQKKTKFQKKISDKISQCLTCERKCKIKLGNSGFCQTRSNLGGEIYTIVYGLIPALSFNPIEKKPLYHFYPGSTAITVGTYGCNFNCFWCQNYHISHPKENISKLVKNSNEFISPKSLIELAKQHNCQGTSISFNEPTLLFEYSLEVFGLAKREGLYNTYITNGYMTEDVLNDLINNGLDAVNIDIKGDSEMVKQYCGIDIQYIWRNAKNAKDSGVHVELTTLLIENFNTDKKIIESISERIIKELGEDTPFHLTRFFPHYKSNEYDLFEPTSLRTLEEAYEIAKKVGLDFVYLGNLPFSKYENTFCPNCSKIIIERKGFEIRKVNLDINGNCSNCGRFIVIV